MIQKILVRVIILGMVIGVAGIGWYQWQLNRHYQVPSTTLIIEEGLGVKQISSAMQAAGYIHSDYWFRTYAWQRGLEEEFIAGTYVLPETLSMKELLEILTSHQATVDSVTVTLIEGWTVSDIAAYIESEVGILSEDFYQLAGYPLGDDRNSNGQTDSFDYSYDYDFLTDKPSAYGLEGYLFPDTYQVVADATADQIIRKALDNFDTKLSERMRSDLAASGMSVYELVTIASILERELLTLEDKKNGASVIYNRLEIGMPLQMDSTVNFVTGGNRPSVTYADLEVDSPYNTYMYQGLPPGPIANPGLDSLIAALYPTDTNYLYFLTDPEGVAYFAATGEGHNQNRALYLR